jgi:hypothetical protein
LGVEVVSRVLTDRQQQERRLKDAATAVMPGCQPHFQWIDDAHLLMYMYILAPDGRVFTMQKSLWLDDLDDDDVVMVMRNLDNGWRGEFDKNKWGHGAVTWIDIFSANTIVRAQGYGPSTQHTH